jgi:hypothetical protein
MTGNVSTFEKKGVVLRHKKRMAEAQKGNISRDICFVSRH